MEAAPAAVAPAATVQGCIATEAQLAVATDAIFVCGKQQWRDAGVGEERGAGEAVTGRCLDGRGTSI